MPDVITHKAMLARGGPRHTSAVSPVACATMPASDPASQVGLSVLSEPQVG